MTGATLAIDDEVISGEAGTFDEASAGARTALAGYLTYLAARVQVPDGIELK